MKGQPVLVVNRFADLHNEITGWRRDLHAHPEILFEVERTAGLVSERLREFGVDEVVTGLGRTGVVGIIRGRETGSGRVIGLRADMDALPIAEITGMPYSSKTPGAMHACGHDGHTAMLLGAAKYLSETRNFNGTVAVIFQPAEENGGGGREMVEDGMMERFGIEEVYGMHNMPGLPVGQFAMRPGPMMAAADEFRIEITGYGGHAARPHMCVDATMVGAQVMVALQSIVARNVDPIESAVISVTKFHAGDAFNVTPQVAHLGGTVRTLSPEVRNMVENRMAELVKLTARAHGATAEFSYKRGYPVLVNHDDQTNFAARIASDVAGEGRVETSAPPIMGGEDFSFMLNSRPGAFVFIGNGDTAPIHHPEYDFNDEVIPAGCSYWARLTETAMPLAG